MSCAVHRDVAGVRGLHLATNVFSPDVEQRLFNASGFEAMRDPRFMDLFALRALGKRTQTSTKAEGFQGDFWRVQNSVKDCGLSDTVIWCSSPRR
mmetsp:Transcript_23868/g.58943  ORF Transcript_23868/g.58943 Transcript_23868/m.58943 type:complete len:95 (-) Transcript_23868:500-784(-)